jgi:putative ABC transport system permease protein
MSLHSPDVARFSWRALAGYPARTVLMLIAMAIGVGSVVVLTALGEGARGYVTGEFASLGTNLVIVLPGRSETAGRQSRRDVRRDAPRPDPRRCPGTDPQWDGAAGRAAERGLRVRQRGARSRDVVMLGSTSELLPIRHWQMAQGSFLPIRRTSTGRCPSP